MNNTARKKYFGCLRYVWILIAVPMAAETVHVYVTNSADTKTHVIDAATGKVRPIAIDASPA